MDQVPGGLITGICIDTCHAFSAGYNIGREDAIQLFAADIMKYIGKDKIRLLHVNDAKGGLGAGLDRHEHIGRGMIGIRGFRQFLKHRFFSDIPIILETPKKSPADDMNNLETVRKLVRK
jgi:deoxyribonuclease-4